MNTVADFVALLFAPFDLLVLRELVGVVPALLMSLDPVFWGLVAFPVARFFLPVAAMWAIHVVRPQALSGPPPARRLLRTPLVSVVIAGRNEAEGIATTLRSVLTCGYSNLEIIYVDDGSDDDSVFVARRMARTTGRGRIRVFASPRRNGKPSALNIGIALAKGEFIAIIDADCELQYGSIVKWLAPFQDEQVGAVAANLRVRNAGATWLTRLQECEYALNVTLSRLWRARMGVLSIVPGAGGLFRASILKEVGGFDTGLGDDTDMTIKLQKQRWKLGFALGAVVWTDVPTGARALVRQRTRWERNMVKIRLRKHGDLFLFRRYGIRNAIMLADLVLVRIVLPVLATAALVGIAVDGPGEGEILVHVYWFSVLGVLLKLMIARDIARTPQPARLAFALVMPFYRVVLRAFLLLAIAREALRIGLRHAYVPLHIWRQTPHW
jgi:cellulose synthase/poly-beta-1,6-N-acetylglucosamine synthase-like glycosyltransferase